MTLISIKQTPTLCWLELGRWSIYNTNTNIWQLKKKIRCFIFFRHMISKQLFLTLIMRSYSSTLFRSAGCCVFGVPNMCIANREDAFTLLCLYSTFNNNKMLDKVLYKD